MKNIYYIFILCIIFIAVLITNKLLDKNNKIKIIDKKILRGPNRYYNKKVILINFNTNDLNNIKKNIIDIHKYINYNVEFCKIINNNIIISYEYDKITLKIFEIVVDKKNNIKNLNKLKKDYNSVKIGLSTKCIIDSAIKHDIPYIKLNSHNLYQLGWGINQKKLEASCTSNTYSISESLCKDKYLTKYILDSIGIPVPKGYIVNNEEDLIKYFHIIKSPVVIKPYDGHQGDDVFVNIADTETLKKNYNIIKKNSDYVLIEEFIKGNDYRVLIVYNKFVAATKRIPPFVIGNGIDTIEELINKINSDPMRGNDHDSPLTIIEIDKTVEQNIKKQGYNRKSVLKKDVKIYLRENGNLSTGGISEDVTDIVHKSIIEHCINAAKQIKLDICGIDIVCNDISKPLEEQNGSFIEMNSGPGLRMHLYPYIGKSRDIGNEIISNLFPNNNGRIPIVSVTGTNGKTTTVNLISFILNQKFVVGKTNTNGIYINDTIIEEGDCSGPLSGQKILMHPNVEIAVFECARGGIIKGLCFDKCDVSILTNIGEGDHIGKHFDNATIQDIIDIKTVILKNISQDGYAILNANEKYINDLMKYVKNKNKLILFSTDKNNKLMNDYMNKGNIVIYYHNNEIILSLGKNIVEIFNIDDIPMADSDLLFQIENIMAAISACYCLNFNLQIIKDGLKKFKNDHNNNPGRFNVIDYNKSKIIVDYAHNMDSINNISKYIKNKKADKKVVLFGAAGDRDNYTISEMTKILYNSFDIIILFVDDKTLRGRSKDEIFNVMFSKLNLNNKNKKVYKIEGEINGINIGFNNINSNKNDIFIVLADDVKKSINYILEKINNNINSIKI